MEDERIVALFFERSELAIRALDDKYGALCRAVALEELDECIADKKTFVEGIHIGLCTQTYSLEAPSMSFTTAPPLRYPLTRPLAASARPSACRCSANFSLLFN